MKRLVNAPFPQQRILDKLKRWYNKRRHRPATPEVGVISELLLDLKKVTEKKLSQPLGKVTIAAPLVPGLTGEDLTDALAFAGISNWLKSRLRPHLDTADAVFAANGNGLCSNPKNLYDCLDEAYHWPTHRYLTVSFAHDSLSTSVMAIRRAFNGFRVVHQFEFEAGLNSSKNWPTVDEYWEHVQYQIAALPKRISEDKNRPSWLRRPIDRVQIHGEEATNPKFLTALKKALQDIAPIQPSQYSTKTLKILSPDFDHVMMADPTFAAARGAALYSRQRQELQSDCDEDEKRCVEERRREKNKMIKDERKPAGNIVRVEL